MHGIYLDLVITLKHGLKLNNCYQTWAKVIAIVSQLKCRMIIRQVINFPKITRIEYLKEHLNIVILE